MPDTPLNPDGIEAAAKALWEWWNPELPWKENDDRTKEQWRDEMAKAALSAYLTVAQPEVNSVEEAERLPHMSVILDSEGCAWQRNGHQNGWATWSALGDEFFTSAIDAFPARVLYRPAVNDA